MKNPKVIKLTDFKYRYHSKLDVNIIDEKRVAFNVKVKNPITQKIFDYVYEAHIDEDDNTISYSSIVGQEPYSTEVYDRRSSTFKVKDLIYSSLFLYSGKPYDLKYLDYDETVAYMNDVNNYFRTKTIS